MLSPHGDETISHFLVLVQGVVQVGDGPVHRLPAATDCRRSAVESLRFFGIRPVLGFPSILAGLYLPAYALILALPLTGAFDAEVSLYSTRDDTSQSTKSGTTRRCH